MTCRIWRNTYLMGGVRLFSRVVSDLDYNRVLGKSPARKRSRLTRAASRFLWFWPRIEDAEGWVISDDGTKWDPHTYLHSHQTLLMEQLLRHTQSSDSLMELGCNCGSDMFQLYSHGYRQLSGVDASGAALKIFEDEYGALFESASINHDLFQRYLLTRPDNSVDFIYSNGATIELVHPSFPIMQEICRVARKGVLLDLSERQQGYPRKYERQMERCGFRMTYTDRESRPQDASHIFVFLTRDR